MIMNKIKLIHEGIEYFYFQVYKNLKYDKNNTAVFGDVVFYVLLGKEQNVSSFKQSYFVPLKKLNLNYIDRKYGVRIYDKYGSAIKFIVKTDMSFNMTDKWVAYDYN